MPPFKICPNCSEVWQTRENFILDPKLKLNGYKADFEKLDRCDAFCECAFVREIIQILKQKQFNK